jgi:hypothetical protein
MMNETIFQLENGIVPFEFDFTLENNYSNKIDWSALQYDDWSSYEFWAKKMPDGLLAQFPELHEIVNTIYESKKHITPLMELEYRERCRIAQEKHKWRKEQREKWIKAHQEYDQESKKDK